MGTFQASATETSQENMQQLEECVHLNNDALVYIKIGETAEAYGLLQEASSILQKMIQHQQNNAAPIQSDVNYGSYFKWKDISSTLPDDDSSSPRSFSLFLQGLWIDSTISLSTVSNHTRGLATMWLIVQFNFALSSHLLGIQRFAGSKSGLPNYQHACDLYQTIHLTLDSWPIIPKNSDFGLLMLAAVLNNQACIYSDFDLLDHASLYWSRFSTALESMIKHSLGSSNTNIKLRIYFRLALNVSIFRGSIAAGAA
jgi:tetratricopeptide (TPR) repeat protein